MTAAFDGFIMHTIIETAMKETSIPRFQTERHGHRLRAMRRNPAGRKNTPEPVRQSEKLRRIRVIRVKDQRGCRMIVAGSNLGGTAGYVMYVPVPSRTILFGAFFIIRNRSEQPEQIGDEPMRKEG